MDYSLLLAIEKIGKSNSSVGVNPSSSFLETQTVSRHETENSGSRNPEGRLSARFASLTKNRYELESEDGRVKYHVALIDYLQEWNLNKKLERYAKIYFKNADPSGLSAIAPAEYQRRFMRFMKDIVFPFK